LKYNERVTSVETSELEFDFGLIRPSIWPSPLNKQIKRFVVIL
jgi:hypothetical protein